MRTLIPISLPPFLVTLATESSFAFASWVQKEAIGIMQPKGSEPFNPFDKTTVVFYHGEHMHSLTLGIPL